MTRATASVFRSCSGVLPIFVVKTKSLLLFFRNILAILSMNGGGKLIVKSSGEKR